MEMTNKPNGQNEPCEKKSLLNALKNLESISFELIELADYSDTVVAKLHNPRPQHPQTTIEKDPKNGIDVRQLDIIDLFDRVARMLEEGISRNSNNIRTIDSIIE